MPKNSNGYYINLSKEDYKKLVEIQKKNYPDKTPDEVFELLVNKIYKEVYGK